MASYARRQQRDCVLVVGDEGAEVAKSVMQAVKDLEKMLRKRLQLVVLVESRAARLPSNYPSNVTRLAVNVSSDSKLHEALLPYMERVLVVTCRTEKFIPMLARVVPHVPYARTPTEAALEWSVDKIMMRRRFTQLSKRITPTYTVVKDTSEETIRKIEHQIGYPLVIKPAGLAQSLLVSIAYHREDLEKALRQTFRRIRTLYKSRSSKQEPKILVEQLMEGTMYSIDAYVNSRGELYYAPPVHIKTGRSVGFDDFFGYLQMTPTKLTAEEVKKANETVEQGVHALGLRSTTVHAELMRMSPKIWKVIEIGPRVGGFRHKMYQLSFGFSHALNDLLIRIPKKPIISKKRLGYTAVMKWFAKKEGRLVTVQGLKKAKSLESFHDMVVNKEKGDMCYFAKNGGISVFNITLFNRDRSKLLADIRRLEQTVKIVIEPPKKKSA
jgi:hypothetical protein